ncbi:MAG: hypothetical protein Q9183_007743, partial [Haloplaca sp. 2 TL-2023]
NIKEGIEGHAVSWYQDVFDLVFPDLDQKAANDVWKKQLKEPEKKERKRKEAKKKEDDDDDDDDDHDDD